jgi:hypothetical protein
VLGEVPFDPVELFRAHFASPALHDLVDLHAGVPDVERRHLGEVAHRQPVRPGRGESGDAAFLLAESALAPEHGEARDQALVPFERAGQGLVEVVDAEDEPPVGSGEDAEVGEVRVAREVDVQSGPRRLSQVRGHQVSGATVEGERREEHAPVPNRHQLRVPRAPLVFQQRDRIRPVRLGCPLCVRRARYLRALCLPARCVLGRRHMLS